MQRIKAVWNIITMQRIETKRSAGELNTGCAEGEPSGGAQLLQVQ